MSLGRTSRPEGIHLESIHAYLMGRPTNAFPVGVEMTSRKLVEPRPHLSAVLTNTQA